jgi:tripartite-type tricarboxylate transporter receptor subunit TctC
VKSGKVKAFFVTSKNRFAGAPEIPTVVEAGLPDLEADYWIGLFAPARTASVLIARINRDTVGILQSTAMRTALRDQGAEPVPSTPGEFAAFVKSESRKWQQIVRTAGIKPE